MARRQYLFNREKNSLSDEFKASRKHSNKKRKAKQSAPLHCRIPPKVEAIKELNGDDWYNELRGDKSYKYNHESNKTSNKPWYFLTKEESITINKKNVRLKRTHNDTIAGYLQHKLDKWKKKNPEIEKTDLFYEQYHPEWVAKYEAKHDRIVSMLSKKYVNKYNKSSVNAILKPKSKESKIAA